MFGAAAVNGMSAPSQDVDTALVLLSGKKARPQATPAPSPGRGRLGATDGRAEITVQVYVYGAHATSCRAVRHPKGVTTSRYFPRVAVRSSRRRSASVWWASARGSSPRARRVSPAAVQCTPRMKQASLLLFVVLACGQPKATTAPPQAHGETHDHDELPAEVKSFHEVLAPRWHADKGVARTRAFTRLWKRPGQSRTPNISSRRCSPPAAYWPRSCPACRRPARRRVASVACQLASSPGHAPRRRCPRYAVHLDWLAAPSDALIADMKAAALTPS